MTKYNIFWQNFVDQQHLPPSRRNLYEPFKPSLSVSTKKFNLVLRSSPPWNSLCASQILLKPGLGRTEVVLSHFQVSFFSCHWKVIWNYWLCWLVWEVSRVRPCRPRCHHYNYRRLRHHRRHGRHPSYRLHRLHRCNCPLHHHYFNALIQACKVKMNIQLRSSLGEKQFQNSIKF